ncbi:RNA polymerase sigma factor [Streptomyces bobili]|uniref:RNA polymerase sigma factor n=1 Tax=Streptomyces bobili TaxID=67280 RepID=UPI00382BFACA
MVEPTGLAERWVREGFARGEEKAMREVVGIYERSMHSTAATLLKDREMARDVVQQALLRAWLAADSYDPSRDMWPWLKTIVRHAAIDAFRQDRKHMQCLSIDDKAARSLDVEASFEESILAKWEVDHALMSLAPEQGDVIRLAYIEGRSQREISREVGVSLGTVNNRIRAGRIGMRMLLRDGSFRAAS